MFMYFSYTIRTELKIFNLFNILSSYEQSYYKVILGINKYLMIKCCILLENKNLKLCCVTVVLKIFKISRKYYFVRSVSPEVYNQNTIVLQSVLIIQLLKYLPRLDQLNRKKNVISLLNKKNGIQYVYLFYGF